MTGWQTFWQQCRAWLGRPGGDGTDFLLSADAWYVALERERLRADRTEATFAVLNFSPVRPSECVATTRELVRILRRRLRGSDLAGQLADGRVGLLLPETVEEGACKVADEILAQWPLDGVPAPGFQVYTYPSNAKWWEAPRLPTSTASGAPPENLPAETLLLQPMPLWKRSLDVVGASFGLLLLAPLVVVIAAAIKLTSRGPVFFKQRRAGRGGQPFWVYKFRSMVVDAEAQKAALRALNERDGPAFKIANDPRITRVGRFLRATNLDELPQLWNVLKGDMSLVGPRPLPCDESDAVNGWQRRRLDVTPGLTCFWQSHAQRARISFVDWVRMDLRYIRSRSPKVDLQLVWQTLKLLTGRKSIG